MMPFDVIDDWQRAPLKCAPQLNPCSVFTDGSCLPDWQTPTDEQTSRVFQLRV